MQDHKTQRWSPLIEQMRKCDGKKRYDSKMPAEQHALKLRKEERGHNATAYPCEYCKGWHVGHRR